MKLFLNNKLVHAKEAMVSIFDHGFLYGIGLFETFRTYAGNPFLLTEHLERLATSAQQLGIAYELDEAVVREQVCTLLKVNGLVDGYFRLTLSAGEGELGLPTADYHAPTTLLLVKPLPLEKTAEQWKLGKTAIVLKTRRNTPESQIRYKSLHYMNNIIAKRELRLQYPQHAMTAEGILLNNEGYITEGIVSNLFFCKNNVVYTPAIDTGILPGITRAFIISLCSQNNLKVVEGYFNFDMLLGADEVWLTNSIQAITPVTTLLGETGVEVKLSGGEAGLYATLLQEQYRQHART